MLLVEAARQESEHATQERSLSRRSFCLCCVGGALYRATGGWLTPRQAFAEARGIVSLIKDSAAVSPIVTHKLRNDIFVLEGSGGNIAVLTESDRIVGDLHLKKLRLEARPFAAEENYNPNPRRVAPRKDAFACFHEQ